MYIVYNYETGVAVTKAATPARAQALAELFTETWAYIDGSTFDFKLA